MNRYSVLALLGAGLIALSACATAPTPTPPPPTAVPTVAVELPSCPAGNEGYVNVEMGFTACHPSGWQASEASDPENDVLGVDITAPSDDAQPVPMTIRVRTGPLDPEASADEILQDFAIELMNRRSVQGRPVVPIAAIRIDGIAAAQDTIEGSTMVETQAVEYTGWVAGFPARERMWYITVSGPREQQMDIEVLYQDFIAQFHLLS